MHAPMKSLRSLALLLLLIVPITGCVGMVDNLEDPETRHKYRQLRAEGQRQLAESAPKIRQALAKARQHPLGTFVGLNEMVKQDQNAIKTILDPLIARLKIFEANLVLGRMQDDKAGNKGLAFALIPCYVERGDIKVNETGSGLDCLFSGNIWPPKPLEMIAAVPLGVNEETIVNYTGGRENLLEFLTNDPNQPEDFQTYFFGDKDLTSGYILAALDIAEADGLLLSPAAAGVLALQCSVGFFTGIEADDPRQEFFCRFGRVLTEIGRGGFSLVEKIADSIGL